MTVMPAEPLEYPVRFQVERPEKQSRLTNFPLGIGIFIRAVLLIPHLAVLYVLGFVAILVYLIATFAILFTGTYPRGMYDLVAGYQRWSQRVAGYIYSLYDTYPPFTMESRPYALTLDFDYPATSSRLLNFPIFGYMIRLVLLIPHIVVLYFLGLVAFVVILIAQFAILFSGAFPAGMHSFVAGYLRWSVRISAYAFGLTDKYPPFSTN